MMKYAEHAIVTILAAMFLIVFVVVGAALLGMFGGGSASACWGVGNSDILSQACIDERFDQCMAAERYTREECIQLVGSR